eukprot:SAG22_NODE_227_length_14641_cov_11.007908_12_plen_42_part_00
MSFHLGKVIPTWRPPYTKVWEGVTYYTRPGRISFVLQVSWR